MQNPPCLLCGQVWPYCGCDKPYKISTTSNTTSDALSNFYKSQIKPLKRRQKNKQPEKEVEADCLFWMRSMRWDVQIYEAKASYSAQSGRWTRQTMQAGTVDCQGVMPSGRFVAVEFKAPGKLKTFNLVKNIRQRTYLIDKINSNAFACVVDSAELLKEIYEAYLIALVDSDEAAKSFLFDALPGGKPKFQYLK